MKSNSLLIAVMLIVIQTLSGQTYIKNTKLQGTIYGVVTVCGSGFAMWQMGGESIWAYSNTFSVQLDKQVTFNISLCDGGEQDSAEVTLIGKTCPWDTYNGTTDTNGFLILDAITEGYYDVMVNYVGYEIFQLDSIPILNDTTFNIELNQNLYPPHNMYVDTLTNIATWDPPLITALPMETFEDPIFPPEGWHETHYPAPFGWYRTDYFDYADFPVPPGDGYYAIAEAGYCTSPTHPNDRLITPILDLREVKNFTLFFDSYYTGAYNQSAYVEYSYNNGETWIVLEVMEPVGEWHQEEIDLSEFSGTDSQPIWVAFHSDDNNISASGWAIDNVTITGDSTEFQYYYVFLNNDTIAQLPETEQSYYFNNLIYGTNYIACVAAVYTYGISEQDCYQWESTFLFPPNNFHSSYIYNNYEVPLWWSVPLVDNTDSIPVGLVSFNIYQNNIFERSIPYQGQDSSYLFSHIVDSIIPGKYVFSVTSVYDLTLYGYPGDTAESTQIIADTVEVIWGHLLPFFEGWDSASFITNSWIINDTNGNWRISNTEGNPQPCAEFFWEPQITEPYKSSITSTYILADRLSEGSIFFDFDIMYESQNSTGNEKLKVEVFDGDEWQLLTYFHNVGNLDYTHKHFDISEIVKQKLFQVKFTAYGINTSDLVGWYIDNINIYRTCDAPYNLTGTVDWFTYDNPANKICWTNPIIPATVKEWLYWDNRINYSGIGLSEDGTFSVAARWFPEQLENYEGAWITKIEYFVNEGFTSLKLKIWKGSGLHVNAVRIKDVTQTTVPNEWNIVELPNPYLIDINTIIWVGYTVTAPGGTYPAGVDSGPGVTQNGDMMLSGGSYWFPISMNGYNNNWNIAVYLDETISSDEITKVIEEIELPRYQGKIIRNQVVKKYNKNRGSINAKALTSFNIYRLNASNDFDYELYDIVEYDSIQEQYCYFDTVPNVNLQNGYYYKVTANYSSDIDTCESAPAMSLEIPEDDFVYIFLEDIDDISTSGLINIFPNPAKDYITITSASPITNIRIINYIGQEVFNRSVVGITTHNVVTSNYQVGVYIVKITTVGKVITKKIMIVR